MLQRFQEIGFFQRCGVRGRNQRPTLRFLLLISLSIVAVLDADQPHLMGLTRILATKRIFCDVNFKSASEKNLHSNLVWKTRDTYYKQFYICRKFHCVNKSVLYTLKTSFGLGKKMHQTALCEFISNIFFLLLSKCIFFFMFSWQQNDLQYSSHMKYNEQ